MTGAEFVGNLVGQPSLVRVFDSAGKEVASVTLEPWELDDVGGAGTTVGFCVAAACRIGGCELTDVVGGSICFSFGGEGGPVVRAGEWYRVAIRVTPDAKPAVRPC